MGFLRFFFWAMIIAARINLLKTEGFKETKKTVNESLLVGSASKPAGVAAKKPIMEVNDQFARWQKLAGIK